MSTWTPKRTQILKRMWAEGFTASQIAGELGGVTRNAVIGKKDRLGLPARRTNPRTVINRPSRKPPPKAKIDLSCIPDRPTPKSKPKDVIMQKIRIPDDAVTLVELNDDCCKFPYGNKNYQFCGQPAQEGKSYCEKHRAACEIVRARKEGSL